MATLIKTDGTMTPVKPKNGKYFTLEEKQAFVGGYIEFIPTREGNWMTINEAGKINGLPLNKMATLLYKYSITWQDERPMFADLIMGDVLYLTAEEFDKEEELMEAEEEE